MKYEGIQYQTIPLSYDGMWKEVDEGSLSKAAKALVSNGIWPRTNDVLLELGRLHPQRNLPIPVDITPQQTIFASEEVLQHCRFPKVQLLGLRDLDRHIYEIHNRYFMNTLSPISFANASRRVQSFF